MRFGAADSIFVTGHKKQGKTTWIKALLASLERPSIVYDPLGEYADAGTTVRSLEALEAALASGEYPHLVFYPPELDVDVVDAWCQIVDDCYGYVLVLDEIKIACDGKHPPTALTNLAREAHKDDNATIWATHAPQDMPPVMRMVDWWAVFYTEVDRHVGKLNDVVDGLGDQAQQLTKYKPSLENHDDAHRWLLTGGAEIRQMPPVVRPRVQTP